MMNPEKVQSLRILLVIALVLASLCLTSCKTASGDDDGSDLPWNTPQPWEGAPQIPGMNGMGR